VKGAPELSAMVAGTPVGRTVELDIVRDGTRQPLQVTIGNLADSSQVRASKDDGRPAGPLGLALAPLTPGPRPPARGRARSGVRRHGGAAGLGRRPGGYQPGRRHPRGQPRAGGVEDGRRAELGAQSRQEGAAPGRASRRRALHRARARLALRSLASLGRQAARREPIARLSTGDWTACEPVVRVMMGARSAGARW
jgi:hypothetical protein